jgi:hypothetical protein
MNMPQQQCKTCPHPIHSGACADANCLCTRFPELHVEPVAPLPPIGPISRELELEGKAQERALMKGSGALFWCMLMKREEQLRQALAAHDEVHNKALDEVRNLLRGGCRLTEVYALYRPPLIEQPDGSWSQERTVEVK